nr:NUDIX hydrolase [Nocardioidaceae bacterium]
VQDALSGQDRVALCSHRPVLPDIFKALGVDPVWLDPAGIVVIHRRDGRVLEVEHLP